MINMSLLEWKSLFMWVIVIYFLCNELPQTLMTESNNMYYLTTSVDQEFRHGLAESSGSRSLKVCNWGVRAALVSRLEWVRTWYQAHSVTVGKIQFFTGHWPVVTSIPCHMDLSIGQLITQQLASWNWASDRVREGTLTRRCLSPLTNRILEVTSQHIGNKSHCPNPNLKRGDYPSV